MKSQSIMASKNEKIPLNINPASPERESGADLVILGDGPDYIFSTDPKKTGINNNILVVGGTGSGKTCSVSEPRLIHTKWQSLIATVTKKRLVTKYTNMFKRRRYDVQDLDFVHPQRGNVAYDPLDYISDYSDITFIARSIVLSNPRKERSNADPYWDETAISLFSAIITIVLMILDHPTFADVLEMLDKLTFEEWNGQIRTNYDDLFAALELHDPLNFALTNWKSFKKLPIRTASCVFGTLNSSIDSVFSPELRTMFRMKKKVNFPQLASKLTVLFITSSPVNPSLNCFINMFYAHAFKQLFEFAEDQPDGVLPIPVHLLADDFATGCPVPLFDQYISIFREKRISVTLLIQSESQLNSIYGADEATTIINNCDTYLYMGSNDLTTARNISLRANKPMEDILNLKIGKQILFRRGARPKIGRRYNIMEDETYKQVTAEYEKMIAASKRFERGA